MCASSGWFITCYEAQIFSQTLLLSALAVAMVVSPESVKDKVVERPARDPRMDISASTRLRKSDLDIQD